VRRTGKDWGEKELILAFNLYCKLPFGQYHSRNAKVIELARLLGRTPGAVAMKLSNFARMDPAHQQRGIRGLSHGSHLEEKVWHEFHQNWEKLAFESEQFLLKLKGRKMIEVVPEELEGLEGKEREAIARLRINQGFFRQMVLASYHYQCAICRLPEERLLVASHIVPWSVDVSARMNPRNGMCLCVLHDKSFDSGLITVTEDYYTLLSPVLKRLSLAPAIQRGFMPYEGKLIHLPDRFHPDKQFLAYHREYIFLDQ